MISRTVFPAGQLLGAIEPSGTEMLSFDDTTFGVQECELNLTELYPELRERKDFQKRLEAFVESDEITRRLLYL